jgi:hypothetical protein
LALQSLLFSVPAALAGLCCAWVLTWPITAAICAYARLPTM